jgi:hypothetical protein
MASKLGRNDPCHCGSGKKYKNCHAGQDASGSPSRRFAVGAVVLAFVVALVFAITSAMNRPDGPNRVWDPEHGHYHDL